MTQSSASANKVLAQTGSYNTSTITQGVGGLDTIAANQAGDGNVATINQNITDTNATINTALVVQNGDTNVVSITQQ
ncbi:MAG: hypothetical protein QX196_07485 [Methylococcaceae bacterium]